MEIFSLKFAFILLIAIVLLTFRAKRKRSGPTIIQGKQISVRGQKVQTIITKLTPLVCLLDDGRSFGADFKDKTAPELPHAEGCQCELVPTILRSHEWFNSKKKSEETFQTDLGSLNRIEYRFYKYVLIANHADSSEAIREDYLELAKGIEVPDAFREKVERSIAAK